MENRRQAQPGQTNRPTNVGGEQNRVARIWICEGNKEGTRQKVLVETHCIRL